MIRTVLAGLAVWRFASLLVSEDGPFYLFGRLRNWVGVEYDAYSQPYGSNEVAKIFSCIACMTVWLSALYVLVERLFYPYNKRRGLFFLITTPLQISAVALIVNRTIRG